MISGIFRYNDNFVIHPLKKNNKSYISLTKGYIVLDDLKVLENRILLKNVNDVKDLFFQNKSVSKEIFSIDTDFGFREFQNYAVQKSTSGLQCVYYDCKDDRIFLNRDLFGLVPLFYIHIPYSFFAFSTDLTYLLNLTELSPYLSVDPGRIANYLKWMNDGSPHDADTFFSQIKSVLPGHSICVNSEGIYTEPYIKFSPNKWDNISTLEDYGNAFNTLFKHSVSRLATPAKIIGSHLSGGLDSSSVSCMSSLVAHGKPIHTFYADTDTESANEGHLALDAAACINSEHHIVLPGHNDFEIIYKHTALCGFPEQMVIGSALQSGLIIEAKNFDCDILMTGTDGDSIVGHGFDYLQQLEVNKDWKNLAKALQNMALNRKPIQADKNWPDLSNNQKEQFVNLNYFYQLITQNLKHGAIPKALDLLSVASKYFDVRFTALLNKGITSLLNGIQYSDKFPKSITKSVLRNYESEKPPKPLSTPHSLSKNLESVYLSACEDVFYTQAIAINEEKYYLSKHYDIALGYPFYDKELFELNLSVPLKIKFDFGRGRGQLRQAMIGILPESIRTRTDKGIFGIYARQAAIRLYTQGKDLLTDSSPVWEYVEKNKFNQAIKLLVAENQPSYVYNRMLFFVNRTMNLAIWLDIYKKNGFNKNNIP